MTFESVLSINAATTGTGELSDNIDEASKVPHSSMDLKPPVRSFCCTISLIAGAKGNSKCPSDESDRYPVTSSYVLIV